MDFSSSKSSAGGLYKWEENNHGLDHHCGVCHTGLKSQKAKRTCFGEHVEPCPRYHGTLFLIGHAHKCEPCRTANEQGAKRTRSITEQQHQILDMDTSYTSSRRARKTSSTPSSPSSPSHSTSPDRHAAASVPTPPSSPSKKAKKTEIEAAKAASRRPKVITAADIAFVDSILHPDKTTTKANLDKEAIGADLAFNASMASTAAGRGLAQARKASSSSSAHDNEAEKETRTAQILGALGISRSVAGESRERKELVETIVKAIDADMTVVENEERARRRERAGYWRYANRATYDAMVRNNELVDWETGVKLAELETEALGAEEMSGEVEKEREVEKPVTEGLKDERRLCKVVRTASLKRGIGEMKEREEGVGGRRKIGGRAKRRQVLCLE